jgi:hypothetical protein
MPPAEIGHLGLVKLLEFGAQAFLYHALTGAHASATISSLGIVQESQFTLAGFVFGLIVQTAFQNCTNIISS